MLVVDNDFLRHRILGQVLILNAFPVLHGIRARLVTLDGECQTCRGFEAKKKITELFAETRTMLATFSDSDLSTLRGLLKVPPGDKIYLPFPVLRSGKNALDSKIF